MRNKKYGPGKNFIKEELIQRDIRTVFGICERYYSTDAVSLRISRVLQKHFENELSVSPIIPSEVPGRPGDENGNGLMKDDDEDEQEGGEGEDGDDDGGDDGSESAGGRKKDKKDKKREKKDKKKKDKKVVGAAAEGGTNDASELNTEDDASQIEAKQQLFDVITKRLTMEQKKGIIPIVFQQEAQNKKQKFEFDLFSLEPQVFKRLEEYVKSCVASKDSKGKKSQGSAK